MAIGKLETLHNGETNIFLSKPETFLAPQDAKKASPKVILKKVVKFLQDAYSMKDQSPSFMVKTSAISKLKKNELSKLNCQPFLDYLNHPLLDSDKITLITLL